MFRPIKGSENKLFTPNERPETAGETYHLEVLRPLIKVSEYLGSWPRDGSQFILRLNAWNGLTLFVLHFYTVHKFFNWMTVVKTTENIFEVFEQLTLITRTAIVALCFDYRFLMHQSNMDLFKIFGSITTLNEEWCLLRLKNIIKFVIGACFFFVFLHVLFASIFMFHTSTDKYVNWLFYGDAADQTPDFVVRMIMIADWALYLYLVICNECFFFGLYIALCLTMLFKVKDFNAFAKRIQKERLIKTGSQVQELYQMHTRLFGFMAICMVASEVGEANSEPIISLIKIAEYGDIEDWVFQQETQLLITKINTPMLKLSGWSCFELNMQFMLTILGALATYAIIIIQMA